MHAVTFENYSFVYALSDKRALNKINLEIKTGEIFDGRKNFSIFATLGVMY